MVMVTDGMVTDRFKPNYQPAINALQGTNILRIGNPIAH